MPKNYSRKTYKNKRTYKRNPFKNPVSPKNILRKLRYTDIVYLNPAAGTQVSHFFSANGIFDPDISGTGHQPVGFDQYMLMYDHYQVLGSKCTMKILPNTSTGAQNESQIASLKLQDQNTASTDYRVGIENGQSSWTIVSAGDGAKIKTISKTFSSRKTFPSRQGAETLVGSATANPQEGMFFGLSSQGVDLINNPGGIYVHVVIDYSVRFTERKQLALS